MPSRYTGVLAAACTQGKRTQHGKPRGMVRDDQPDAREGRAGCPGVAERFGTVTSSLNPVRQLRRTAGMGEAKLVNVRWTAALVADGSAATSKSSPVRRSTTTSVSTVPGAMVFRIAS
jgi:hypothetical protein